MFQAMYFEEYETGAERTTLGRTITETDIVIHAGQTGDFYPHHMDAEWCKTQEIRAAGCAWDADFQHRGGDDGRRGESRGVLLRVRQAALHQAGLYRRHDHLHGDLGEAGHKRPGFGIVVEHLEVTNQRGEPCWSQIICYWSRGALDLP